jgi:hypothetical protein
MKPQIPSRRRPADTTGTGVNVRAFGWRDRSRRRREEAAAAEAHLDEVAQQIHRNIEAMDEEMERIRREQSAG